MEVGREGGRGWDGMDVYSAINIYIYIFIYIYISTFEIVLHI